MADGDAAVVLTAACVSYRCHRQAAKAAEREGQNENPAHRPGAGRPQGSAVRR